MFAITLHFREKNITQVLFYVLYKCAIKQSSLYHKVLLTIFWTEEKQQFVFLFN